MSFLNIIIMKQTEKCLFYLILISFTVLLSGCLSQEGGGGSAAGTGPTTIDLGFSGITAAENQDGTTVKISWMAATNSSVTGYRIYEVLADSSLSAVGQTNSSATSFFHVGLSANTSHTYRVRAFNVSNQMDTNVVEKTAYTYPGITTATATGTTTATISFSSAGSNKSGVRIYATARGTTSLVATGLNTSTSANITGLKAGTTYSFSVKSYDFYNVEDANVTTASAQTTPTWISRYQGPILVKAYGLAPTAPSGAPQTRQVSITWSPFSLAVGTTAYSLVRVLSGNAIDTTTTTACTSTTDTSCRVCTAMGSSAPTCIDTNVGAPPKVYEYMVTLNTNSWPEEAPVSNSEYRITVPIPPDNMVLVHRDSVNYEACLSMGKVPDPLNHQRCSVSGASMLGATPYNTGPNKPPLNLPTGYYDFGYNVFFDRWEAACNWTPQAEGGMCGAGGTTGNCFGAAADPVNTFGIDGNVYYRTDVGTCWVKQSGTWLSANNTTVTAANQALMYTVMPSLTYRKPPLAALTVTRAWDICQAVEDFNYGKKRLPRNREWKAAAAWQYLPGEPEALSDAGIAAREQGSAGVPTHTTLGYCNSLTHASLAATAFNTSELAGDAGDVVKSFTIGSTGTKNCVSRYGIQDMIGNIIEMTSDYMTGDYATRTYYGIQSPLDSGNGYSAGFDLNGYGFDGVIAPNYIDTVNVCNASTGFTATTDPPGAGGGNGTVARSTTNICYIRRDAATWVTTASATPTELTAMHAMSSWLIQLGVAGGTTSATGWGAAYFNYVMGLPMFGTDNGNNLLVSTLGSKLHSDYYFNILHFSASPRTLSNGGNWGHVGNGGRWLSYWGSIGTSSSSGFRCVLPAE